MDNIFNNLHYKKPLLKISRPPLTLRYNGKSEIISFSIILIEKTLFTKELLYKSFIRFK